MTSSWGECRLHMLATFSGRGLLGLLPRDIGFKRGEEIRKRFSLHNEHSTFLGVVNSIGVGTICVEFSITSRKG